MTTMKTLPKCLTTREITVGLKSLRGWHYSPKQKAISVDCKMKDFMTVIRAIQKIAKFAEKANHHPDLYLTRYRHLRILLSTHEVGGVTERDFSLAKRINIKGTS
ncbi:MAG TPA: 4a-hydroxytetrahydrobiopterin dehydratase [bacterium]|nr:4a-hydroxytetrahydrobiopterin dehydratase [bacterium]